VHAYRLEVATDPPGFDAHDRTRAELDRFARDPRGGDRFVEADRRVDQPGQARVPGEGVLPPRNAEDIAWSEYNHHWAGLFVLAIGLLALAERTGHAPWARHWPLLFIILAAFLFIRSDPEVWPLGDIGFFSILAIQVDALLVEEPAIGVIAPGVRDARL